MSPAASKHRDVGPAGEPDELNPTDEGRRLIAVIGIDHYESWPRLNNAVSDARGTLQAFIRMGFVEITKSLFNAAATADALRSLVMDDLASVRAEDSLILFFAGHGHTVTTKFESGDSIKTGYIIPADAAAPGGSIARWIRLDSWLSDVARLPARHVLVILDACYSGIALDALVKWRDANQRTESVSYLARRRSRKVITSAHDDQLAMDSGPLQGHSLFTGCLLEALDGGIAAHGDLVTGSELGLHLQKRITSYSQSEQTPDWGALEHDKRGEMILQIATFDGVALATAAARDISDEGVRTTAPAPGTTAGAGAANQQVTAWRVHASSELLLAASGLRMVTADAGVISTWRVDDGQLLASWQSADPITCLDVVRDRIAIGTRGGDVLVFHDDGRLLRRIETEADTSELRAWESNGIWGQAYGGMWSKEEAAEYAKLRPVPRKRPVRGVALDDAAELLVAIGDNGQLLWCRLDDPRSGVSRDIPEGATAVRLLGPDAHGAVVSFASSARARGLRTLYWYAIDPPPGTSSLREPVPIDVPRIDAPDASEATVIAPHGPLVVGTAAGTVLVLTAEGTVRAALSGLTGRVAAIACTGTRIAACDLHEVRWWDDLRAAGLGLHAGASGVAITTRGEIISTGRHDGSVRIWRP